MCGGNKKGLNDLRDEAWRIAREHGFKDATIGEDLMLMVTELAEAMEDHRAGRSVSEVWYEEKLLPAPLHFEGVIHSPTTMIHSSMKTTGEFDDGKTHKPCGIPSELADVVIRILHFAGKHGIDIEKAVKEKMVYNETREFKHGKRL